MTGGVEVPGWRVGRFTEAGLGVSFTGRLRRTADQLVYDFWTRTIIDKSPRAPRTRIGASWDEGTEYYDIVHQAMMRAEFAYARDLLRGLHADGVDGAIVEFGVAEGDWLSKLIDLSEEIGMHRPILGFDSFQGLPAPSAKDDLDCWTEGQYAADYDSVCGRLRVRERENVKLYKGWFKDTLQLKEVQSIENVAFVRIDCDLFQPAVECLEFLTDRLSDGAILVFDDWTYDLGKGETKAFRKWARSSGMSFDFLCNNLNGHFYMRVRRT